MIGWSDDRMIRMGRFRASANLTIRTRRGDFSAPIFLPVCRSLRLGALSEAGARIGLGRPRHGLAQRRKDAEENYSPEFFDRSIRRERR